MKHTTYCGILLSLLLSAANAQAASPYALSYGGRLANASDVAEVGPVDLEIKFYTVALAGTPVGAPLLKTNVPLADGVFQVDFELTASERATLFGDGLTPVWIEITDKTHNKNYPRQMMSSVPFALNAARIPVDGTSLTFGSDGKLKATPGAVPAAAGDVTGALGALKVEKLQGVGVSATPPTSNQVLQFSGGVWTPTSLSGGVTATDVANVGGVMDSDFTASGIMKRGALGAYSTGNVDLTSEVTGTLPTAKGGTGVATAGAALVFAGPTTGGAVAPSFRALGAADIPALDSAKIATGTLDPARIPSLDGSKITTGSLNAAQIPPLDAAKITTGTFATAQIPALDGNKITAGTVAAARLGVMTGSTGVTAGASGAVPTPGSSDNLKFLRGDGQWSTILGGTNPDAAPDGTAIAPSHSFASDTNTGIYRPAADSLGFTANGAEKMRVDNNGVAVGTTPSTDSSFAVSRTDTTTTSNPIYAVKSALTANPSSPSTASFYGGHFTANNTSTQNVQMLIGAKGQVTSSGNGVLANAIGVAAFVKDNVGGGNMTNVTGVSAAIQNSSTSVITNAVGLSALSVTNDGGGSIATYKALELTGLGASDNYSIYVNAGKAYFAEGAKIGIGTQNPNADLEVRTSSAGVHTYIELNKGSATGGMIQLRSSGTLASDFSPFIHAAAVGGSNTAPGLNIFANGVNVASNEAVIQMNAQAGGAAVGVNRKLFELQNNGAAKFTVLPDGKVGMGTTSPAGALEISSTSTAFIPPRMTTAQRAGVPTVPGSVIYNTDKAQLEVYNGVWSGVSTAKVVAIRLAGGCAIQSNGEIGGDWVNAVGGTGGACTLTFQSGYFANPPSCTCSPDLGTSTSAGILNTCYLDSGSTTGVNVTSYQSQAANSATMNITANNVNVSCVGN